ISTFECLTRGYEVKAAAMPTLDDVLENLKVKISKRLADKCNSDSKNKRSITDNGEGDSPVSTRILKTLPVSKPVLDLRGHTSYLTFAVLPP
ncbi:hypothetical protein L0F63_006121, partial [Massospora cicadina]